MRRVDDTRLEIIFLLVQGAFKRRASNDCVKRRKGQPILPIMVSVDARDLSPLLAELRHRRRQTGKMTMSGAAGLGEVSQAMMKMAVGDVIKMRAVKSHQLVTARRTARKRLENPQAMWFSRMLPDGYIELERMPDGTNPMHRRVNDDLVKAMASMTIGNTLTIAVKKHRTLHQDVKIAARDLMNYPAADWTSEKLTLSRIKLKRIS